MPESSMNQQDLSAEITRLNKIISALMDRAEHMTGVEPSAYDVFQSTVMLEDLVRSRTRELEAALQRNEKIGRELQLASERMVQSEENFRNIVEYAPIGMCIVDMDFRYVLVNKAFCELVGYAREELEGLTPLMLTHPEDVALSRDNLQRLMDGEIDAYQIEKRYICKDGHAVWAHLTTSLLRNVHGAPMSFIGQIQDITEQKKAAELAWTHANYDALTQLPNRRLFRDRLEQGVKKAERNGDSLALLFIDLDHFKEVNDTLGHQAGDDLLVQVAQRITAQVRASDTVARLGGDEFTVILCDLADASRIERVAQSLVETLSRPFVMGKEEVHVSASIGVIVYPEDAQDVHGLLKGADKAMYRSKNEGRNRFSYFGHH